MCAAEHRGPFRGALPAKGKKRAKRYLRSLNGEGESAIVVSRILTCLAKCSSETRAFLLVIRRLLWPSSLWMLTKSTPPIAKRFANEWRKSCQLKPVISAASNALANDYFRSRMASPAWLPAACVRGVVWCDDVPG